MHNQETTELTTERLYLRTLTDTDVPVVRRLYPDEFETDEAALDHIRWITHNAFENRFVINFYIWLTTANQCIGRVYLHAKPELDGEVEIGYGISKEQRNKGYATEAAKAAVRFAFEKAGQEVLAAIVKPKNISSRCVIEKAGFTKQGVRMVPDENGEVCEFDYYQYYRDDWRSHNKKE